MTSELMDDTSTRGPVFLDNDPHFVASIQDWLGDVHLPRRATDDPEQCLSWVRQGVASTVVVDLRMPGVDGVTFLEGIRELNATIPLFLLTGYTPEVEERSRLDGLNVRVRSKLEIAALASELKAPAPTTSGGELLQLRSRLGALEELHQEWIAELRAQLEQVPDPDRQWIEGTGNGFSVADLIADLRALSPRGVQHIRLWQGVMKTLRAMGRR